MKVTISFKKKSWMIHMKEMKILEKVNLFTNYLTKLNGMEKLKRSLEKCEINQKLLFKIKNWKKNIEISNKLQKNSKMRP